MSLAQKLSLYALVIALLPLAATGFSVVAISQEVVGESITARQALMAQTLAARVDSELRHLLRGGEWVLKAVGHDLADLSPEERHGVLLLLSGQDPSINSAFVAGHDGAVLSAVRRDENRAMQPAEMLWAASVLNAMKKAKKGATPNITTYLRTNGEAAAALKFSEGGVDVYIEWVLTQNLLKLSQPMTVGDMRVYLLDASNRLLVHPQWAAGADFSQMPSVLATAEHAIGVQRSSEGGVLAGRARVATTGWSVIVEQDLDTAFAVPRRMRWQMLWWMGCTMVLVLLSALLFARRLRRRLSAMVVGARRFGSGNLEEPIMQRADDELGELASTMNSMAQNLGNSLNALNRLNEELELRVEDRTTELKEAQAQLLIHAKLAAVGQLGAGVAHEINNPLSAVIGFTQILRQRTDENHPSFRTLQRIEEAALRCHQITAGMLRFSERTHMGTKKFALRPLVHDICTLLAPGYHHAGVRLEQEFFSSKGEKNAPFEPELEGDPAEVALLLNHLLSNALQAYDKPQDPDDTAEALTRVVVLKTLEQPDAEGDPGILFEVIDSGRGIGAEDLPRVFEPFFTTKPVWGNVGLGLSVCYRIVSDHGGTIRLESTEKGTRARAWLPILSRRVRGPSTPTIGRGA